MKRDIVSFAIVFTLLLTACGQKSQEKADNKTQGGEAPPVIEFEQVYYDFGSLSQGERVSYIFEFKNTGGSPLLIKDAFASCGCTVPRYDKEPIAPGGKGSVEVIFDSSGRRGNQYKTVIIRTNTPRGDVRLTIKANVIV